MRFRHLPLLLLLALGWAACGSGPGSSPANTPASPTNPGGGSGGGSQLTTPTVIKVASGSTTSGINITVPNTASAFNVEMLGVNSPGVTQASASNVGGAVARGATALVLIFGPGLTGSENLAFSGPNDIAISGEQGIKASDGTPGIEFTVTVASGAAVGARTLMVTNSQNSASTFVGGLEVY